MANTFSPSNVDLKTGKVKPKIIIGVDTPADKYVPPKAEKPIVITARPAKKVADKPAPKAVVATKASGEGIREAITATKRREKEAGLD
jgi:hypothetical protein